MKHVLILIVLIHVTPGKKIGSSKRCREPKNLEMVKRQVTSQMYEYQGRVAQFYNIPNFLESHKKQLNTTVSSEINRMMAQGRSYKYRVYGEPSCKRLKQINRKESKDDMNSSTTDKLATCPWHVILDFDENRNPARIMKAVCTCKKCFSNDGTGYQEGLCQEVETFSPVIRKYCVKGVYEYFVDIESVSVGCTCKQTTKSDKTSIGL